MHVYHYNHTERSALERLAADHGVAEVGPRQLVETGLFVDLFVVARNAIQVGTESYGLKPSSGSPATSAATTSTRAPARSSSTRSTWHHDPDALTRIAAYNEDDVRATRALRDWLVEHRPGESAVAVRLTRTVRGRSPELDAQVAALHAFGSGDTGAPAR